jgi:hypothetical protein
MQNSNTNMKILGVVIHMEDMLTALIPTVRPDYHINQHITIEKLVISNLQEVSYMMTLNNNFSTQRSINIHQLVHETKIWLVKKGWDVAILAKQAENKIVYKCRIMKGRSLCSLLSIEKESEEEALFSIAYEIFINKKECHNKRASRKKISLDFERTPLVDDSLDFEEDDFLF